MKTYKGLISKLQPNQIFVFGSNPEGRHGAGSAKWAYQNAGAILGQGYGLMGQSYGIVTTDLRLKGRPNVSRERIEEQIDQLYNVAGKTPDYDYLIGYTGLNTYNLSGYSNQQFADMFSVGVDIPSNIIFEEEFSTLLKTY